jgi:terminase large subunit-like protein
VSKTYILKEGSIHEKFFDSYNEIQLFGGGFGNGKTSAMCVKAIVKIAIDYPGCTILMARSTYPKLNSTLRRVFLEFCPEQWIKSFPLSKNSDNTCVLTNGSIIDFRYISQRKTNDEGVSVSNLLSATYDLIVVDQIEDPEITYKDFLDLVGRLRGDAVYRGKDPKMPRTGPRWMFLSCNPSRGWVYKKLVEPLHKFQSTGLISENLLCEKDQEGNIVLYDGRPRVLLDLVEGSTYENAHVLPPDFIKKMESIYTGQMKDRFLRGQWASYEGLIYPEYNATIHQIRHDRLMLYLRDLIKSGYRINWQSAYDYGMVSPSCYLLSFSDPHGNIFVLDGFYQREASIEWQADRIAELNYAYSASFPWIYSDPDIFRRKAGDARTVGKSVDELFHQEDNRLRFTRGNNDISSGIAKVSGYLRPREYHIHPITGENHAPYLYHSDRLEFIEDEITSYHWIVDSRGDRDDRPVDKNDHSMDTLKYLLSFAPEASQLAPYKSTHIPTYMTEWQVVDNNTPYNAHRH